MRLLNKLGLEGYNRENHIIGFIFILSILLPHTGILYLVNPLLLLYLIKKYSRHVNIITPAQYIMAVIIVISIVWSTFTGIDVTYKSMIRSLYILLILFFFPFCGNIKMPLFYIYFVVVYILLSQLCYVYNIGSIISFFDKFYPYTGDIDSETTEYLLSHAQDAAGSLTQLGTIRFGGLFHNSNQCMKYISLCTIAFVMENYRQNLKSFVPFLFLVFICSILAGSRTGFMTIILTLIVANSLKSGRANLIRIISFAAIGFVCLLVLSNLFSNDFRLFQISEGFEQDGSISLKYANLKYYLGVMDSVRAHLVGNASIEDIRSFYKTPFSQFDSEWGNAIYFYGFIFFFLYTIFLVKIVTRLKGVYIASAFMLIWVVSSTILFSYRTSFAFFLLLSKYINSSKQICYGNSL